MTQARILRGRHEAYGSQRQLRNVRLAVAAVAVKLSRRTVLHVRRGVDLEIRRPGIRMLMRMVPNVKRGRRRLVLAVDSRGRPGKLDWQHETDEKQQPTRHSVRCYLLRLTEPSKLERP